MDNQAIEQIAVSKIRDCVNMTRFLSSYLDENDKTPSWDGFINIYSNENKSNDSMIGRLAVQVKGHETTDFSKDEISYSINVSHLRNYLNDGGVLFFVVYLSPNKDYTDFNKKAYYAELTPGRLSSIISECSCIQLNKTIHLKALPTNRDDFASIVYNCYMNCKRQASFAGTELPTAKELADKGVLESLQVFVSGYGEENRGYNGFLKLDTPLYAKIKGSAIPQPLKYEGEMVEKTVSYCLPRNVTSNGLTFYNQYRVVATVEKSTIHIGFGITLEFNQFEKGCRFNFKAPHMLRQFVSDAPFMIAFMESKAFEIDDIVLDFSKANIDAKCFTLEGLKTDYEKLSRYVEALDRQGCNDDVDYTALSPEDWLNLERLAQATLDGKPVDGFPDELPQIIALNVGNLRFAVRLMPIEGQHGAYVMTHAQDFKGAVWSSPEQDEKISFPTCAVFKEDDYATLSNIRFEAILPEIIDFPENKHTYALANDIMLRMISASDKSARKRKEILLKTAMSIDEWLISMPEGVWDKRIAILNKLQIIKRQRPLNEQENGMLKVMISLSEDRQDVLFAAFALLGQKDEALTHYASMNKTIQEELKRYPIYHFVV